MFGEVQFSYTLVKETFKSKNNFFHQQVDKTAETSVSLVSAFGALIQAFVVWT